MTPEDAAPDALMDPWCLVPLVTGERILFGFARRHPVLGGLSWASSSPVVHLDERAGRAVTASGRRYALGRRIQLSDIPTQGEEAWLSFELLIGAEAADSTAVPSISTDPGRDREWVAANKMARHLGVAPPSRAPSEIQVFFARHLGAYLAHRTPGKPK